MLTKALKVLKRIMRFCLFNPEQAKKGKAISDEKKCCQLKKKPKYPKTKKGEYKKQNGRTHVQEDKRTT
jgi:hypothetical protein